MEGNYFTILWWFLPYIDMDQPWVYMCPPSRNSSYLPPHPIPLGCPSVLALSALFHASNLDRSSISHMVIYMFQCCSLKSSHTCLLPQSPKDCFYICVSFAVSHIGSPLSSFQIPYICISILYWCFLSGLLHSV